MMRNFPFISVCSGLFFSIAVFASSLKAVPETRQKWEVQRMDATVVAIDLNARDLTLRGSKGELFNITAPATADRLNEIEVGDTVYIEKLTYIAADFRAPTPEELANPVNVQKDAVKSNGDKTIYGASGRILELLVTIEIINRPDMLVTIKDPQGKFISLPVKDPALISQLHVGQLFFLTYGEGVALSLEALDTNRMSNAEGE